MNKLLTIILLISFIINIYCYTNQSFTNTYKIQELLDRDYTLEKYINSNDTIRIKYKNILCNILDINNTSEYHSNVKCINIHIADLFLYSPNKKFTFEYNLLLVILSGFIFLIFILYKLIIYTFFFYFLFPFLLADYNTKYIINNISDTIDIKIQLYYLIVSILLIINIFIIMISTFKLLKHIIKYYILSIIIFFIFSCIILIYIVLSCIIKS